MREHNIWREVGVPVLTTLLALGVWELSVRCFNIPEFLLPKPSAVFVKLVRERVLLLDNALATASASLGGFLLAASCAFLLALILAKSTALETFFFPHLVAIKVTPITALVPLLIIWLGHGILTRIVIAALISFFPIVVNTLVGLKSPDPDMLALLRSYSASEWDILRKVRIPTALPFIFSSFRVSVTTSLVGAIVAELVACGKGLGHLLSLSQGYMDTERLFAVIVVAAGLGFMFFGTVTLIERRLIRWHESQLE